MVMTCVVPECNKRAERPKDDEPTTSESPKITYHRFPKDAELRYRWIRNIPRDD